MTNIGDKPVTLRSITMAFWPSRYQKLLRKNRSSYYLNVIDYHGRSNVSALIDVGHDWFGFIVQTSQLEDMMDGYLEIQANHSLSVKPVVKRLVSSNSGTVKSD